MSLNIEDFRKKLNEDFLDKFNCKFLGPNIERIYDSVCVGFITPIFKMIISIAVVSGGMFIASLYSNLIAIRYARNCRKDIRVHDSIAAGEPKKIHKNSS